METTTTCANCGKGEEESNNLKACVACKMVKYCNRDCQIAHRKQHKKACKKRAAELYDEKLFKEVEREECPICLLPMPIDTRESIFHVCCGKNICNGCCYEMVLSEGKDLCPFCRAQTRAMSPHEHVKRMKKLIDNGNALAFYQLGGYYERGLNGVPQDSRKAVELYLKAGQHGCPGGYFNLGMSYDEGEGVEVDKKKAKHYYELAAIGGSIQARNNLGCMEGEAGNEQRALKHLTLAAKAGNKLSLDIVKDGFMGGMITKDEYENTLRLYQARQDEMKSDARDKARVSTGIFANHGTAAES